MFEFFFDFIEDMFNYSEIYIEVDEVIGYVEDYENFVVIDLYGQFFFIYFLKEYE